MTSVRSGWQCKSTPLIAKKSKRSWGKGTSTPLEGIPPMTQRPPTMPYLLKGHHTEITNREQSLTHGPLEDRIPETATTLLPRLVILCSMLPSKNLPILYTHPENVNRLLDHGSRGTQAVWLRPPRLGQPVLGPSTPPATSPGHCHPNSPTLTLTSLSPGRARVFCPFGLASTCLAWPHSTGKPFSRNAGL